MRQRLLQRQLRHASTPSTSKAPTACRWAATGRSARLAQAQHRDDWVTNTAPDAADRQARRLRRRRRRACSCCTSRRGTFSALFNVHGRDLNGTARLFRANIIKPGTNDLVDGFDPYQVADRRPEQADPRHRRRQRQAALGPGRLHAAARSPAGNTCTRSAAATSTAATARPTHRRWARASSRSPTRPPTRCKGHAQLSQEFRVEHADAEPAVVAGRRCTCTTRSTRSTAWPTTRCSAARRTEVDATQINNAWAVFGSAGYQLTPDFKLRGGVRYTQRPQDAGDDPDQRHRRRRQPRAWPPAPATRAPTGT